MHHQWVLRSAVGSPWGLRPLGAVSGWARSPTDWGGPHPSDPPNQVGAGGYSHVLVHGCCPPPPALPPAAATAPPVPCPSPCPSIPPLTPTSDPPPARAPRSPVPLSALPVSLCPAPRPSVHPSPSLCPAAHPSRPTSLPLCPPLSPQLSLRPSLGTRCSGDRHRTLSSVSSAPPGAPPPSPGSNINQGCARGQVSLSPPGSPCPPLMAPVVPPPPATWPPGHRYCVAG